MKKNKLRSLVASVFLALNICFSVATPAHAVDYNLANGISTSEMTQGINNEVKGLNAYKVRESNTQNSVLYNMKFIVKQATWVDMLVKLQTAEKTAPVLGYSSETVNYEKKKLLDNIAKFNKYYGQESEKFAKVELMKTALASDGFDHEALIGDVTTYMKTLMDKMITDSGDAKKAAEANKKALKYMYYICDMDTTESIRFNSMMPADEKGKPIYGYTSSANATAMRGLLNDAKYKELLNAGREITQADRDKITTGDIDPSKELVELLLKGAKVADGKVTYANVSKLWYLYFSGSAVYQPFNSKVGGDEIKKALNNVANTRGEDNNIITTFNKAVRYRKPLYAVGLDGDGKVTGTAKEVTLKALMEKVENKETGALVLPEGRQDKGTDANSYYYYKDNQVVKNLEAKEKATNTTANKVNAADAKTTVDYYGTATGEITDKEMLSDPVLTFGKVDGNTAMGGYLLANIFKSVTDFDQFHPDKTLLYMTAFGDIVLEDGTVVLPGSANPTYIKKDKAYYPYTVAFLSSYPGLSTGKIFNVTDKVTDGKYVFYARYPDGEDVDASSGVNEVHGSLFDKTNTNQLRVIGVHDDLSTNWMNDYIEKQYIDGTTYGFEDDIDTLLTFRQYSFKSKNIFGAVKTYGENGVKGFYMSKASDVGADGSYMALFTARPETLEDAQLGAIAKNYFSMAMSDADGEFCETPDDRFDTKLLADGIIVEGLNGLTNIQGYITYRQTSYEELVKDGANRFKVMYTGIIEDFMDGLYKVAGVVGIENAYQSQILGTVVSYARAFMYFIIVLILIGLVFKFMRQSYDIFQASIAGVVVIATCWLFVSVVPVYIPTAFNGALDILTAHKSSDLGYVTLMMHMEDYDTTYGAGGQNKNASISNTASINLYKFKKADLTMLAEELGITMEKILKGDPIIVDENAGLYIEGDTLKCSLDKLFYNNPISSNYTSIGAGKYYTLTSSKQVSSSIDYYTPYHLIVDGLVEKLNGFNTVFPASRETINYGKLNKDSFVMRNYVTSVPFLQPEDAIPRIAEQYDDDIADAVTAYMGDVNDTFNLKEVFKSKISNKAKESLWYQTMEKNGRLTDEQIDKMTTRTQLNTKQFLIDNYDKLQYMSDENIIKITALYETVSLTRQAGVFNDELYPMFINVEEFDLGSIVTSAYVSDRSKFRYKDLNIADYIIDEFGVIWGTVFAISTAVSYLIVNITSYEIPILYILLGILLVVKYIMQWESKKLIRGYIRGTLLIFIGYFIHCAVLTVVGNMETRVLTIIIPLFINATILEMFLRYTLTIFRNPFDLGGNFNFATIAPVLSNISGFTGLCAGIGGAVGATLKIGGKAGKAGVGKGKDHYEKYRDLNAYDEYAGQDAVINKVMNKQESHRKRRYEVKKETKGSDSFSDYRE